MAISTEILAGKRVLLVEDEYFIAAEVSQALKNAGATVLGPFARQDEAEHALAHVAPDVAVLDIDLRGNASYTLADELIERAVPFMFVTGYDEWHLPRSYRAVPRLTKPTRTTEVVATLASMVGQRQC